MSLVTDTIEAVVASLTTTTTFMRTSKLEEANLKLPQTDLSTDPVALYFNLPTVDGVPIEGRSVQVNPVEIAFIKRAAQPDTTGLEDDVTRDAMEVIAIEFYHSLVKNYTNIFEKFEGYTLEPVLMDKQFSEIMVGMVLKTEIRQMVGFGIVSVVATLVNSEGTTINTLSPAETKTQPDITVTQQDDTTALHPSDKDLDVDNFLGAGITTFAGLVAAVGLGHEIPGPTGQVQSKRDGDDANIEVTILSAARNAQSVKARNTLASFNVLNNNNSFGNTIRFTDDLGTEIFTAGLMIDNYTSLMWGVAALAANTWPNQIDAALASTLGGFSNWFMANINQLRNVMRSNNNTPFSSLFTGANTDIWSSTDDGSGTTNRLYVSAASSHRHLTQGEGNSEKMLICRLHTFA